MPGSRFGKNNMAEPKNEEMAEPNEQSNCCYSSFDLKKDFIDYWDEVVNIWLKGGKGKCINAMRPLGKGKECYYKDNDLRAFIEDEQYNWFDNFLNPYLCPIHLPEPYWGNPKNCSIVIVNYNPGGGTDMSPHTYKGHGHPYLPNTMIDFLDNGKKYSDLALDFPIMKSISDLDKDSRFWLRSYGGRKWWLSKKEWLNHLVEASLCNKANEVNENMDKNNTPKDGCTFIDEYPPFAIELCAWHSNNWPSNASFSNPNLQQTICKRFICPLLKAIENSKSKLAVCIGKNFGGLDEIFKTKSIFENIKILFKSLSVSQYGTVFKDNSISVEREVKGGKKRTRNYRVFNIQCDGKDHIIINTYAQGSNKHPSALFKDFENALIKEIKTKTFLREYKTEK